MLTRAARRRNVFHHLRLSTEQLPVPWLCPANVRLHTQLNRPENAPGSSSSTPSTLRRRRSFSQPVRHLATTAEESSLLNLNHDTTHISFESMGYPSATSQGYGETWTLPPLYNEPAIVIQESQLTTEPSLKRSRGVGGTVSNMLARFTVALKTRDVENAARVLDRMAQFYDPKDPVFLDLHNRYLELVVTDMIANQSREEALQKAASVQVWFEVKLPQGNLKPNARTMAVMLRMALRIFHGSKRERLVRRYWNMVQQNSFEDEIMYMNDLLTERDLGEISQICPTGIPNFETKPEETEETPAPVDDVQVLETQQKGLGLSSLKKTLSLFPKTDKIIDSDDLDSEESKERRRTRQLELEKKAVDTAKERWQREMAAMRAAGVDTSGGGKTMSDLLEQWFNDLVVKIKEEIALVPSAKSRTRGGLENSERADYGIFLRALPPDTLAAVTVMHMIHLFARAGVEKGIRVPAVVTSLGQEVQNEVVAQAMLARVEDDLRRQKLIKKVMETRNKKEGRMQFKNLVKQNEHLDPNCAWPVEIHARVGGVLLSLLFDCAKAPVPQEDPNTKERVIIMEPAFQHSYEISRGRKFGVIHAHPQVSRRLIREAPSAIQARHMPMLSEPKQWSQFDEGGFLGYRSHMMRCTPGDTLQKTYMKKALEDGGLPEVRAGLDILGKTAWTINNDVFDVMLEAWNSGKGYAKIPPLDPEIPMPVKPEEGDAEGLKLYNHKLREVENLRSGLHSQRCFINFQMEIARAYKNETFYLPHNMDFRGRAYPLPAYLNQMSADNARSLLLFKKAKRLGATGLRWLKIHLSNVYGYDKASLKEREEFAMEHLDDILDSANKGLHGRRWFLEAEDPWQCLAACCELRNALQLENPEDYMSRLPIHQDGSCNGLQHYAALGGDMEGAQHVNLEPGDRPKDIYTGVADFVTEKVDRDAAAGNEIAKLLQGKIKRKIVKQTVMTNVYGVTFVGAIRQVRRQLAAHYPGLESVSGISKYVAAAIFEALSTIFSGAHSIQYWLGDCVTRISQAVSPDQLDVLTKKALKDNSSRGKSKKDSDMDPLKMFRSTIIWTTPLGLPVVQPYRASKCRRVYTTLQSLQLLRDTTSENVSKRKQLQAFPPNFIHSLDATHMMLSAIDCHRKGLVFSAVHDSFWTHACDIDTMNIALRDCFIRMHTDDIIGRLAAEFRARYDGYIFLAKIPESSRIAKEISSYRKANHTKNSQTAELLLEHQRQTLLRSDDPVLQEKGRAMKTAASIFENMNGTHNDLAVASTLGETGVGNISIDQRQHTSFSPSIIDQKDPAVVSLFTDLDPHVNPEADGEQTTEEERMLAEPEAQEVEEDGENEKPRRQAKPKMIWAWLPLEFRDIPKKGEFDVKRLKDSQYFFS
ncbi:hypothetical protein UA08_07161 [Talaromyces atroroseus]|uniref:DNA-directed RNA polymerase n=1 Tax=Talaromyces atroroseus TaxID=1441469 RepID=A0A225APB8_TALAT|nr:hypothetical protein UA08_07161 [Talaromyces atroroseus]OKL57449.1 hypothetical protein UA08_07161 [Talaromyces atroroseus]